MTDGGGIRRFPSPRGPRGTKGYADDAVLSDEEVLRRVDLREAAHPDQPSDVAWIGAPLADDLAAETQLNEGIASRGSGAAAIAPAAAVATSAVAADAVRRSRFDPDDRRRLLWRDTATILIAVVLALLAGQVFLPQQTAGPAGSATPFPSAIAVGSVGPPVTLRPGATFGPILNPSLGVDATPTPIPVITLGPSPSPSPSPSIQPSASVRPSEKPTPKPSVKPPPQPTQKPTATPTPQPTT
jgi:cell division septation protein DedD